MLHLLRRKTRNQGTESNWPEIFRQLELRVRHPLLKDFYSAVAVDGETPLNKVPLVAMDFETTGLNPSKDAIVSIGLVPMTIHRIFFSRSLYWVVNPGKPLRHGSVVIHKITHADVKHSPGPEEIIPQLLKAMAGSVMVVHYRQIERQFLNAAMQEHFQEGIVFPVIDTMDIEDRWQRRGFSDWWARVLGLRRRSIRLAASRTRYNLPVYPPHHALTDALATAELFQAQAAWHYTPDTPLNELWR